MALADLPVWAYVPRAHAWADRGKVRLAELVERPLLTQTRDYHPRRALDSAMATARLAYSDLHEFGSAEVAQAVAAAGRGVAVVSDDPRFGLRPLAIDGPTGLLGISLYAAWHPDHHGAATIQMLAARLAAFCVSRYGEQVTPPGRGAQRQTPAP
jgi:DNA-binding transcriptional LysR family regulator